MRPRSGRVRCVFRVRELSRFLSGQQPKLRERDVRCRGRVDTGGGCLTSLAAARSRSEKGTAQSPQPRASFISGSGFAFGETWCRSGSGDEPRLVVEGGVVPPQSTGGAGGAKGKPRRACPNLARYRREQQTGGQACRAGLGGSGSGMFFGYQAPARPCLGAGSSSGDKPVRTCTVASTLGT